MMTPITKFANLDEAQLNGMIAHAARTYPFLEYSNMDGLRFLSRMMINSPFMLDSKATPIRSSYLFLREIAGSVQGEAIYSFTDRDFVFCIKMFGLAIRVSSNSIMQFMPENQLDDGDEEVLITDHSQAKTVEVYVSDIHKHTKIQTNSIESATNKLLRNHREVELAKLFAGKVNDDGWSVGRARDYLRNECNVKDHEFIRIRDYAISLGIFQSKRSSVRSSRRATIDDDNMEFVEAIAKKYGKNGGSLTLSQAVNKALKDLRLLTRAPVKTTSSAGVKD